MKNSFITNIEVEKSRNLVDFNIPLSEKEPKHLVITGPNGSGKTSLLESINMFLEKVYKGSFQYYKSFKKDLQNTEARLAQLENLQNTTAAQKDEIIRFKRNISSYKNSLNNFGGVEITFSDNIFLTNKVSSGEFIIAYFGAKRENQLRIPKGVEKIDFKPRYGLSERANQNFIQYIVNLKADRSFARDDNETETVEAIDNWFKKFENSLRKIIGNEQLKLKFDRKNYNFNIIEPNKQPYGFDTLSDGYAAIINIVMELILRMEAHNSKNYNLGGIVLIDEIETHLHVELQKKVLPFLIDFFPHIQFIVSTHSPFIISSVQNAVVCDLESRNVIEDLSTYSYDALVESYFSTDKYSDEMKLKLEKYEELMKCENLSEDEKFELRELKSYFDSTPKYLSKELAVKLQQISLQNIKNMEEYGVF